jgi:hypothetical protein
VKSVNEMKSVILAGCKRQYVVVPKHGVSLTGSCQHFHIKLNNTRSNSWLAKWTQIRSSSTCPTKLKVPDRGDTPVIRISAPPPPEE